MQNQSFLYILTGSRDKLFLAIEKVSEWVLLALGVMIFYDVLMRYLFNSPTIWTLEISEYVLVFLAFAGAANLQKKKKHIKMDFFYQKLSRQTRAFIDLIIYLLTGGFSYILLVKSVQMTIIAYKYGSTSNSLLEVPLYIPYAIVPFGMGLLLIQAISDVIDSTKKLSQKEK